MSTNLLVVEDEKHSASLLIQQLQKADPSFTIGWIDHGSQVVREVKRNPPDLILLDLNLPGMNGIEVCKEIRKFSMVPIIMVTVKNEEIDRLQGLEIGADDYICKPYSIKELVARIKSLLRRSKPTELPKTVLGCIELDEQSHEVTVNEKEVILTPIEFTLLKVFLKTPDRVFSRSELLDKAQGYEFDGYERTIDSHIKNLRKKISQIMNSKNNLIKAIYGIGYKLNSQAASMPDSTKPNSNSD